MRLPVGSVGMVGIMDPPVGMGKIGGQVLEIVDPLVRIDTGIDRLAGLQVGIGVGDIVDIVDPLVCAAMNAWSAAVPHIDRGIALKLCATGVGKKATLVRTVGVHPLVQGMESLGEIGGRKDARVAHIFVA